MTRAGAINPRDYLASEGSQPPDTSSRDTLLAEVVDEYLAACRVGQRPDVSALVAQHPEIADDLAACLASLDFLENIGEQDRLLGGEGLAAEKSAKGRVEGTLGDFRILGEVGRGGMGVVYEARQISLNRRVALKVLPFAGILDDRAKKRFQNEALAAAQLDHPHIVDVYGVGCERGVHYYAMRLIEGRSLAEIVQHLRDQLEANPKFVPSSLADLVSTSRKTASTAAGSLNETLDLNPSSPSLTPSPQSPAPKPRLRLKLGPSYYRSIATIGMHIAEALDHAHEQGVLHRDVKPSNLMLDSVGKVWITDFGLARIESAASLTHTGDLLGTLRYMSPEQALAKRVPIDHRSDIYSLGVTLYELLTLQPAFDSDNRGDLLRQVAFEEPIRLRQIDPQIPLDLETIVLKTIEKNPTDRYATSQMLVDDLRHFLAREPIKARPTGLRERCLRLARRHSLAIVAALGLTVTIAAALGVAFVLTYKARNDAVAKGEELQKRHEQTVVILKRVNGTVDSMLSRLSSLPAGDATRLAIIEDEVAFYSKLKEIERDNPAASDQLALALHRIGHLQIELSRLDEAESNLETATAIFQRRFEEESSSPVHAKFLCHAWMNLGRIQILKKDNAAAIKSFQQSIVHGEHALQISPDDADCRMALAFPWGQLGKIYASSGRTAECKAAHEKEIQMHQENVDRHLDHWEYRLVFGMAMAQYADSLAVLKELEPASRMRRSAIGTYKELHQTRPDDELIRSRLSSFLYNHATSIMRESALDQPGKLEEAEKDFQAAIQLQPNLAQAHCNLGHSFWRRGAFASALDAMRKGHELGSKDPLWRYPSAAWVAELEGLARLDAELMESLQGGSTSLITSRRVQIAEFASAKKHLPKTAVRLYEQAFVEDPPLAHDLAAGHRYNAACAALQAATGKGKESEKVEAVERARLQHQALAWLQADLAAWEELSGRIKPEQLSQIVQALANWQEDSDLASIRDAKQLQEFSPEDQELSHTLWAAHTELVKRLREKLPPKSHTPQAS